jgi:hypothetical protein
MNAGDLYAAVAVGVAGAQQNHVAALHMSDFIPTEVYDFPFDDVGDLKIFVGVFVFVFDAGQMRPKGIEEGRLNGI